MDSEGAGLAPKVQELLRQLVVACKASPAAVGIFPDEITNEAGELIPSLRRVASQNVPMIQLYQEKRQLLAAALHPQKLIEKIEQLKDAGAHGLDLYLWMVSQINQDPDLKKLVSRGTDSNNSVKLTETRSDSMSENLQSQAESLLDNERPPRRSRDPHNTVDTNVFQATKHLHKVALSEGHQVFSSRPSASRGEKGSDAPKPLIEGVSYPATPKWNNERPYLTGQFQSQTDANIVHPRISNRGIATDRDVSNGDSERVIGLFAPSVQELLVIDDLLFAMVGIEGKYVRIRKGRLKEGSLIFQVDSSMDLSLQELTKRILPLCENYMIVSQFTEARLQFKYGLVNHAFAAALRAILQDYHAMVAQLEHQFRVARLSLQGLWFFCQPMMGAMQALASVVQKATARCLSGAAVLNLLQSQASAMAGDNAARALLQKLTQAASIPYFGILERWVYEGVIDDPYGEFFIDENKVLQKESLSQDYNATYWQQRYSLRHDVPGFLSNAAEKILTTGKYLNAIRECGHTVRLPFSEDKKLTNTGPKHHYLDRLNVAYDFSSAELLKLIVAKFDLLGRLRSIKHYFLMDQGDFLVHFMDIAKEELLKRPSAVSLEKLQSLLELALRTSVAAADPFHEDLTCSLERSSLIEQLQTIIKNGAERNLRIDSSFAEFTISETGAHGTGGMTGLETFVLDYKIRWPLSLVISRKALTKYQLIFRHLFHCKHVERQLCGTWQAHQATRGLDFIRTSMPRSYVLCQQMVHFMQSFEHYMTFEVLEANWHIMDTSLQNAKSIDEVMQLHELFLDKCLKECILLWPNILKKIERLKSLCLQYATTTQWLIPSLSMGDQSLEPSVSESERRSGHKDRRTKNRNGVPQSWKDNEDANFKVTISQMEEDFKKELKELMTLLGNASQTEPCLAHLAQGLHGAGQEY